MAGELKGKTYEAVLKVVLDDLVKKGTLKGRLFWNEKSEGLTIEPDFTVGKDKNHPTHVFLVTHSGSAKDSEKKFWRNIGELAEAKTRLSPEPLVMSIAFDSVMKADLKVIQEATFDAQLVVGDAPYGKPLQLWVETNAPGLPRDGADKADAIRAAISDKARTSSVKIFISRLTNDVRTMLGGARSRLPGLWALARQYHGATITSARDTFVRRGMMKAALFGGVPVRGRSLSSSAATIADELKMARKEDMARTSLVGMRIVDRDLVWLANSTLRTTDVAGLVAKYATDGFRRQVQKVRSVAVLPHLVHFIADNLRSLRTKDGMLRALRALHADPGAGVHFPSGVSAPATVWMFDIVGAIVKAGSGKAQDFGYSSFAKHPEAARSMIGNMNIGTWCSCFMNQFFNRQPAFRAPAGAVEFCARVLASALSSCTTTTIAAATNEIREQYINKELEVGLLTHRGFDPIGALLLEHIASVGLPCEDVTIQAGFAERAIALGAEVDARSSRTSLLRVKATGLTWQSAHDSHTNDKRKELCGRALAAKYGWDVRAKTFQVRPTLKRLLLIVDGTWKQDDLEALVAAGWDQIFYPDEMEKVVRAIV